MASPNYIGGPSGVRGSGERGEWFRRGGGRSGFRMEGHRGPGDRGDRAMER
jgi:hypothetical protein